MVLYSRMFTVTNCDSFTRNFLTKLGVRLNEPVHIPDDPYSNLREEVRPFFGIKLFFRHSYRNNLLQNKILHIIQIHKHKDKYLINKKKGNSILNKETVESVVLLFSEEKV